MKYKFNTKKAFPAPFTASQMKAEFGYSNDPQDPLMPEQQAVVNNTIQQPQQYQQNPQVKQKNQNNSNLTAHIGFKTGDMMVAGLGLLNRFLPDHESIPGKNPQLTYNPFAQGTGSQAIMEFGGTTNKHYGRGLQPLFKEQPYKPSFPVAKLENGGKRQSKIKVSEDYNTINYETPEQYTQSFNKLDADGKPMIDPYEADDYNIEPIDSNPYISPSPYIPRERQQIPSLGKPKRTISYESLRDSSGNMMYSPVFNGHWNENEIEETLPQLPEKFGNTPTIRDINNYKELWAFNNNNYNPTTPRNVDKVYHTTTSYQGSPQTTYGEYDPNIGYAPPSDYEMRYGGSLYNFSPNMVPLQGKSGIHIKPENKGKFNALKKRTGKSTEELTHSKNPLTRKRAIFAQNFGKKNN